jgi:hypothetical protein
MLSYTFVIGFLAIGTAIVTYVLAQFGDSNLWTSCPLMWLNPAMLIGFAFNPDSPQHSTMYMVFGLLMYVVLTVIMLWGMIVGFRRTIIEH